MGRSRSRTMKMKWTFAQLKHTKDEADKRNFVPVTNALVKHYRKRKQGNVAHHQAYATVIAIAKGKVNYNC